MQCLTSAAAVHADPQMPSQGERVRLKRPTGITVRQMLYVEVCRPEKGPLEPNPEARQRGE